MGAAAGDYNGDGLLDLVKTHFADDVPALYRNLGKGLFEDVATSAGLNVQNRYVEWGAGLADFDNDGLTDLLYVTGNVYPEIERSLEHYPHRGPRIVFRNRDGARFDDLTSASGPGPMVPHSSRGAAFGDIDNDGDVDVVIMNMNEPPSLLRNERWRQQLIQVALDGGTGNRSAVGVRHRRCRRQAAGARVLSQTSYYSHDDVRLHFGLGRATSIDEIEVRWSDGTVQRIRDAAVRKRVTITKSS